MLQFLHSAWANRTLLLRLTRREIVARYKGSLLGVAWAALMPLVMIGIYAFVFGSVMRTRWVQSGTPDETYGFAMLLFGGFIFYSLFAEAIGRSPGLMLENPAYIKKVVFPLEILPWVAVLTALANAAIAFAVFLVIFLILYGLPPLTMILLPLIVMPIVFLTLGFTYFIASFGVFLRDLRQLVPLMTTALLFLSPVFYPLDSVPPAMQPVIALNPITIGIMQVREVIFWGRVPNLIEWSLYTMASLAVAAAGAWWFGRTKKAFADVL